MTLPNFFIIGAAKAGTTSLYANLRLHPQIYLSPVKEPRFYLPEEQKRKLFQEGHEIAQSREQYLALFKDADQSCIGEASPQYMSFDATPSLIHADIPRAKIISILRQPAERAYSSYSYMRVIQQESLPFDEVLRQIKAEPLTGALWKKYMRAGFYYQRLRPWFETFDRSQIRVYLYDDLKTDPKGMLCDICRFLEVDESLLPNKLVVLNVTGVPKNTFPLNVIRSIRSHPAARPLIQAVKFAAELFNAKEKLKYAYDSSLNTNLVKPDPIKPEQKRLLTEYFQSDIMELEGLIQKDLRHWLET